MKDNSILYGILAGLGLLIFYLTIISLFQGIGFAFLNLRSLWYLIFPLAIGFGTQIGLFASIKHTAIVKGVAGSTGGISAGSMIACCSHFLLNLIPIAGLSGISLILMSYQKWFLVIGIISNIIGIGLLIRHKKNMKGGNLK
jgi:hypothetical protein